MAVVCTRSWRPADGDGESERTHVFDTRVDNVHSNVEHLNGQPAFCVPQDFGQADDECAGARGMSGTIGSFVSGWGGSIRHELTTLQPDPGIRASRQDLHAWELASDSFQGKPQSFSNGGPKAGGLQKAAVPDFGLDVMDRFFGHGGRSDLFMAGQAFSGAVPSGVRVSRKIFEKCGAVAAKTAMT